MRADNHGEGGILALTALLLPRHGLPTGTRRAIIALGVFGTALLYGDGLITPAISVLSAVEGFEVATTAFESWVVPVSVDDPRRSVPRPAPGHRADLPGVRAGDDRVVPRHRRSSGWRRSSTTRACCGRCRPGYGVDLFVHEPGKAFLALGSIFLVVTGGEALYADMGHFGRRPIQLSWYVLVMPALLLNYFGQAALLASSPGEEVGLPFFRLAPEWAVTPLAVLATIATVIASQALISGAFSLTAQAVQLDYLPRLDIRHTSPRHIGQIYVPLVNWLLMIGCVGLVIGFRSSSSLAAAYGIAVTATMAITTLLFYRVTVDRWGWSTAEGARRDRAAARRRHGVPRRQRPEDPARRLVPAARRRRPRRPDDDVAAGSGHRRPHHAAWPPHGSTTSWPRRFGMARRGCRGTAVYMFKDPGAAPPAMVSNLRHNHVLHERTVVLSILTSDAPRVQPGDRQSMTASRRRRVPGGPDVRVPRHARRRRRTAAGPSRRPPPRPRRGDVLPRTRIRRLDPRGRDAPLARAALRGPAPWRRQRLPLLPPAIARRSSRSAPRSRSEPGRPGCHWPTTHGSPDDLMAATLCRTWLHRPVMIVRTIVESLQAEFDPSLKRRAQWPEKLMLEAGVVSPCEDGVAECTLSVVGMWLGERLHGRFRREVVMVDVGLERTPMPSARRVALHAVHQVSSEVHPQLPAVAPLAHGALHWQPPSVHWRAIGKRLGKAGEALHGVPLTWTFGNGDDEHSADAGADQLYAGDGALDSCSIDADDIVVIDCETIT